MHGKAQLITVGLLQLGILLLWVFHPAPPRFPGYAGSRAVHAGAPAQEGLLAHAHSLTLAHNWSAAEGAAVPERLLEFYQQRLSALLDQRSLLSFLLARDGARFCCSVARGPAPQVRCATALECVHLA